MDVVEHKTGISGGSPFSRLFSAVVYLLAVLVLTSCGTWSSRIVTDPQPAISRLKAGGKIREEADRLARPLLESGEVTGMVIGVVTAGGDTHVWGYGSATYATNGPAPNGDTVFQIGSMSKLFLAAVLEQLVQEGKMRYDEKVGSILPGKFTDRPNIAEITVEELITHTTGFPREPMTLTQLRWFIKYLFTGRNLYGYLDQEYLYKYVRHCHLTPKAKRTYVYSNVGLAFLAHLIEVKTGQSLPTLIEQRICGPLGLRDTTFALNDEQRKRLAAGHVGDQPKFVRRNRPLSDWTMSQIMLPVGGMYSTANDLLIFSKANLGMLDHPLEPLFASTHKIRIKSPEEDVALGWIINEYDFHHQRTTIIHKAGMVAGYSGYLGMNKESRVAVVVLCGNFNWHDKVGCNLVLRLANGLDQKRAAR